MAHCSHFLLATWHKPNETMHNIDELPTLFSYLLLPNISLHGAKHILNIRVVWVMIVMTDTIDDGKVQLVQWSMKR